MYVSSQVTECDITGKVYDKPVKGVDVIAQGATGRWCCVMTIGPERVKKDSLVVITIKDAEEACMEILRSQNELRPDNKQYSEYELFNFIDF